MSAMPESLLKYLQNLSIEEAAELWTWLGSKGALKAIVHTIFFGRDSTLENLSGDWLTVNKRDVVIYRAMSVYNKCWIGCIKGDPSFLVLMYDEHGNCINVPELNLAKRKGNALVRFFRGER